MPNYHVVVHVESSVDLDICAANEEEARRMAEHEIMDMPNNEFLSAINDDLDWEVCDIWEDNDAEPTIPAGWMEIRIYQVNMGRDHNRVAFQGLDGLERFQGSSEIESEIYDKVYEGEVPCETLEGVYRMFNLDHPNGYTGRSLSVSDVVEVTRSNNTERGFYFCDNIGFQKVEFDNLKAFAEEHERMKKNDRIFTPRFCSVTIEHVYGSRVEAAEAGYTEPTYYEDPEYGVAGKSLDMYHMVFAGYRK